MPGTESASYNKYCSSVNWAISAGLMMLKAVGSDGSWLML